MTVLAFSSAFTIKLRTSSSTEPFFPKDMIMRKKYPIATPKRPAIDANKNTIFNDIMRKDFALAYFN